jgi:hypothetical protein
VGDPGVQESSRRGLSTFLADHEDCGQGFDIQRREGTDGSIVRVICGGCGEAIEYPAAADEELPAEQPAFRSVSQRILNRDRRSTPKSPRVPDPRPAASPTTNDVRLRNDEVAAAGAPAAASGPAFRPLRLPSWLSIMLILALIGGGVLLIVLGIADNSGTSDSTPAPAGEPLSSVPLTTSSVPVKRADAGIKLDRRQFAERVSIGIPPGWNAGVDGPAVTVAALNGRAEVQVYFEDGARPDDQLMQEARAFLLQRHAGAHIAAIGPTDLGGREVRRVRVVYSDGTETAVVLVAGGYSYLVLERLAKPFSADLRRTNDAVVASFRPI